MSRISDGAAGAILAAALAGAAGLASAQPRTPLNNVVAEQVVQKIEYCRGEYRLMMANEQRTVPELNLRFKTDASAYGPERGKLVLLPAGCAGTAPRS